DALDADLHQAIDQGGNVVTRLASPGVRRTDGSVLVRARVHVDPGARDLPPEPDEAPAVPEPITTPANLPPIPPDGGAPSAPPPANDIIVTDEEDGEDEEVVAAPPTEPISPRQSAFNAPFGDLTGEGQIHPDEAAAAAKAVSQMP